MSACMFCRHISVSVDAECRYLVLGYELPTVLFIWVLFQRISKEILQVLATKRFMQNECSTKRGTHSTWWNACLKGFQQKGGRFWGAGFAGHGTACPALQRHHVRVQPPQQPGVLLPHLQLQPPHPPREPLERVSGGGRSPGPGTTPWQTRNCWNAVLWRGRST